MTLIPGVRAKLASLPMKWLIVVVIAASLLLTAVVELEAAAKYRARVFVTSGQSIGINPLADELDFGDLPQGAELTRFVVLESQGKRPTYVWVVAFGGISELMSIDRTSFVLNGSESARIAFRLSVPPSAPERKYSGFVLIFKLPYFSL